MERSTEKDWSFVNLLDEPNSKNLALVDVERLLHYLDNKSAIFALGSFVSKYLRKADIDHLPIDHPSHRNRKFNDPPYEDTILIPKIRSYLDNVGI